MRIFLIDSENINFDSFIKQHRFKKKDEFFLIGNATLKFSLFSIAFLQNKKVKFYDFNESSKDYADKIILTLLGFVLAQKKVKKCFIVSNDKIFSKLDFVKKYYKKEVKVLGVNNENNKTKKLAYHIELFEKNQELVQNLRKKSKDVAHFHHLLQKHFKINGTLIYRYLKAQKNEEYFSFKKTKPVLELKALQLKASSALTLPAPQREQKAEFIEPKIEIKEHFIPKLKKSFKAFFLKN